jgi:hypothetical protein
MVATTEELTYVAEQLKSIKRPEDFFGPNFSFAQAIYHKFMRQAHPDLNPSNPTLAVKVSADINVLWAEAQDRNSRGIYGTDKPTHLPTIASAKGSYILVDKEFVGDVADLYRVEEGGIVKVARSPKDTDLLANEARILGQVLPRGSARGEYNMFIPSLVDSFRLKADHAVRAVNVLDMPRHLYSLREVIAAHGELDPKHMTWMYRRLLKLLGYIHRHGVIHAAITIDHVLIDPAHGLHLCGWSYAVKAGETIKAIPQPHKDLYPEAVFKKIPPRPGLDIAMAAQCMVQLMGGNPETGELPLHVPAPLHRYFKSWWVAGVNQTNDANKLLHEYDELIERLWPRKFIPFQMPFTR